MKKILLLTLSLISICYIQNALKADTVPTQTDLSDFHDAITKGNLSKMTEILDKYQNDSKPNAIVNRPIKCVFLSHDYADVSPLGCAIENRNNKSVVNDIVKILIKYGANVNKGIGFATPLERAVARDYDDVVKTLIDAHARTATADIATSIVTT